MKATSQPLLLIFLAFLFSTSCTILRDTGDENNGGQGNGNGGAVVEGEYEPKTVDILVLTTFDDVSMASYYDGFIQTLLLELALKKVDVAHIAYAPMYHRNLDQAPLFFGVGDTEPEFDSFSTAYAYFSSPDGLEILTDDPNVKDGMNLAQIGAKLDRLPILHPSRSTVMGRAYFDNPQDGLIVIWLNASPRRCELSSCRMEDGTRLDDYLSATDEAGNLKWLHFAEGQSLPKRRVAHLFFGTAEDVDYETFADDCTTLPGFPAVALDYMQESKATLYEDLSDSLDEKGIVTMNEDLCDAMSLKFLITAVEMALTVRRLF
jgi:hypothetical protein